MVGNVVAPIKWRLARWMESRTGDWGFCQWPRGKTDLLFVSLVAVTSMLPSRRAMAVGVRLRAMKNGKGQFVRAMRNETVADRLLKLRRPSATAHIAHVLN